jgi:hypothetical protein
VSITGHLIQVEPETLDALRRDPARMQALFFSASTPDFSAFGGPDAFVTAFDQMLRGIPVLGWLVWLVPRALRRWLLRRWLVPDPPPGAPPPGADPPPEMQAEVSKEVARLRAAQRRVHNVAKQAALPRGEQDDDDGDDPFDEDGDGPIEEDDPEELADAARAEEQARGDVKRSLDLHKHWQILHWYLTGKTDEVDGPAGDAILGGESFGEDLGYGPPRALTPARVRAVADLLARLGPSGVVARKGPPPQEMYGADFWDDGEEDFREESQHYAEQLCSFYAEAAREGRAVVLWLS